MLLKLTKSQVHFLKSFDAIDVKLEVGGNIYDVMSYTKDCHWILGTFIVDEYIEVIK